MIRHGVTRWNKEKRYCGSEDIGLSSEGRFQVRLLSGKLGEIGFDKIYCSSSKRARQSARILFKDARIISNRSLREIGFGILEGMGHKEIMQKHADIYKKWLKDPFKNNLPGAEPMNLFKKRVENALSDIVRSNSGKTTAVVCHGGVIGVFVNGISKRRNFWRCVPSPASVTIVECGKGRPMLRKFNDTTHLKGSDE